MTNVKNVSGQEFYDLLVDSWNQYIKKWGEEPDVLYINSAKFAEFFKWSSLDQQVIRIEKTPTQNGIGPVKYYVLRGEVKLIKDFSPDFIWLEKIDVINAIKNNSESSDKYLSEGYKPDYDEFTETPTQKIEKINIPKEVLALDFKDLL